MSLNFQTCRYRPYRFPVSAFSHIVPSQVAPESAVSTNCGVALVVSFAMRSPCERMFQPVGSLHRVWLAFYHWS